MTIPVFDPIPIPSRNALDNLPPPATSQSAVLDANFDKVNQYLATVRRGFTVQSPCPNFTAVFGAGGGFPMLTQWPTVTFTVPPTGFFGAIAWFVCCVKGTLTTGTELWLSLAGRIQGTGVAGGGPASAIGWSSGARDNYVNCAGAAFVPASQFVPGGAVTMWVAYETGYTQQWDVFGGVWGLSFI